MDFIFIGSVVALITITAVKFYRSKKLKAAVKEELLWFQMAIYGLTAAHEEVLDNFEDNIYLGYYCNEIRNALKSKYPPVQFQYLETQYISIFSARKEEERKGIAASIKSRLIFEGFSNFTL